MWFNNALIYQYELEKPIDLAVLLADMPLKPCPPHARFIYGWLPVFAEVFSQETRDASLFMMGKEERILPRGVIHRLLAERIETLELQQNRTVKRAEKLQLAEELEFELLPKAFCIQKRLPALLDPLTQRLIINTSSTQQASQLTSLLRKAVPGLHMEPLSHSENLSLQFSEWIKNPSALPKSIELASDCLLFSPNDEKKRFTCRGYELPAQEIMTLLSQGLAVAELSIIWNERIQLTLTDDFTFKKIKCLDYLVDEFSELRQLEDEAQQQEAALLLLAAELRGLTDDLLKALPATVTQTVPTSHVVTEAACSL